MKMTKSLLIGAVAFAAVLFTGCDMGTSGIFMREVGNKTIFHYTDATYDSVMGKWTFDKSNEAADKWIRGGHLLQTKHDDMEVVARVTTIEKAGVAGIMFNAEETKDRTDDGKKVSYWDFGLAGVIRTGNNTAQLYVSYYANINENEMGWYNFGAAVAKEGNIARENLTPDNGKAVNKDAKLPVCEDDPCTDGCSDPYEIDYTKITKNAAFVDVTFTPKTVTVTKKDKESGEEKEVVKSNTMEIVIDLDAHEDGSYTVTFWDTGVEGGLTKGSRLDKEKAAKLWEVTLPAETLGKTSKTQTKMGAYVNVYPQSTFEGSLTLIDTTKEAIEIEE